MANLLLLTPPLERANCRQNSGEVSNSAGFRLPAVEKIVRIGKQVVGTFESNARPPQIELVDRFDRWLTETWEVR